MSKFIVFYDMSASTWTTLNVDNIDRICLGKEECILVDMKGNEYTLDIYSYQRIISKLSTVTSDWMADVEWVKEQCKSREVSGLRAIDINKSSEEPEIFLEREE